MRFYRRDSQLADPIGLLKRIVKGKAKPLLLAVAVAEYNKVLLDLHRKRCPFCGLKVRVGAHLWHHLRRSECRMEAIGVVYDILSKYREFRKHVDIKYSYGRTKYLVYRVSWFFDLIEAYESWVKHNGNSV
jgi:hypothetical protein